MLEKIIKIKKLPAVEQVAINVNLLLKPTSCERRFYNPHYSREWSANQ